MTALSNLRVSVAQFPISLDVQANLRHLRAVAEACAGRDLLVVPEGVLSGYDHDLSFLDRLDRDAFDDAVRQSAEMSREFGLFLIVGTCWPEAGGWSNAALGLAPDGERFVYRKVNLAHHERSGLRAGDRLGVWTVPVRGVDVRIGVQICREIRYGEQWRVLARQDAHLFAFLANAVGDRQMLPVWRAHLISRAAETQRYVLAANNAAPEQKCPTMIVDPKGAVLDEIVSDGRAVAHREIDLAAVSSWYLDQAREDVVQVVCRAPACSSTTRRSSGTSDSTPSSSGRTTGRPSLSASSS